MTRKRSDAAAAVTAAVIEAIEAGTPPWRAPWGEGRGLALPLRSCGTPYRCINVATLWGAAAEKGYANPRWMTYRQAQELGGQVRRGERGSLVVKHGIIQRPEAEGDAPTEDMDRLVDAKATRCIGWSKKYTVFNVEQIEGLGPEFHTAPPALRDPGTEADPAVMAWFGRTGLRLESTPSPYAFWDCARDVIHLPPETWFEDRASHSGVLLHEAVHATGAEHRLDRVRGRHPGDDAYAREELVAELGSAMLAARLGLAPRMEQNAAYLAHWISILRSDSRAILRAATAAQAAADWLVARGGELDGAPAADASGDPEPALAEAG